MEDYTYWKKREKNDERKDWRTGGDWLQEYWDSQDHPHRDLILQALENFSFESVLEIGCNVGVNLRKIKDTYSIECAGIDANKHAIEFAKSKMDDVIFECGDLISLPFFSKSYDIVLSDAVLMYTEPKDIETTMNELDRVANKGIILVEWDSDKKEGELKDHHWAYDFKKLLEERNYYVKKHKITEKEWPSKNWTKNGCLYIASRLPFQTLRKN